MPLLRQKQDIPCPSTAESCYLSARLSTLSPLISTTIRKLEGTQPCLVYFQVFYFITASVHWCPQYICTNKWYVSYTLKLLKILNHSSPRLGSAMIQILREVISPQYFSTFQRHLNSWIIKGLKNRLGFHFRLCRRRPLVWSGCPEPK